MSAVNTPTVQKVLASWASIAEPIAQANSLDPDLVLAVMCQESAGQTYAVRVERAFWARYGKAALGIFKATKNPYDDQWAQYPDFVSASYGLMQILYETAVERGVVVQYPTQLCDPAIGIDAGCRQLRYCLTRAGGDVSDALRRYNGGANLAYPGEVIAWQQAIHAARCPQ